MRALSAEHERAARNHIIERSNFAVYPFDHGHSFSPVTGVCLLQLVEGGGGRTALEEIEIIKHLNNLANKVQTRRANLNHRCRRYTLTHNF